MRANVAALLVLVCVLGLAVAESAAAKAPKKKPVAAKVKFDGRYECAKVAPASLLTSLAGGFGGTYGLKRRTLGTPFAAGGYSHCDYSQSAGYPWSAKAEGPGEVTILYGPEAVDYYKRDHAAAVEGVKCTNLKAQNPNVTPDPRQCGPVAITGFGPDAYEAASYIAVLRGKVFLQVDVSSPPDANGQPTLVPADLLMSIEKALLARLPAT